MTTQNVTRYVRYESGGQTSYGILEGETIHQLAGEPFGGAERTGQTVSLSSAKLLLPVDPDAISKIICVVDGYNKPGDPPPWAPHPFISPKMQTALIPSGEAIEIPPESHNAEHRGSMVVVIGKQARGIEIQDAPNYVFGVAVGNDISERAWLDRIGGINVPDRIIAKSIDTWGPLGYEIVSGLDYNNLNIETKVNGQIAAQGNTKDMVTSVAKLIHYCSTYMTLLPGDLIYTDAPVANEGMAGIKAGDTVEVTLEGVGTISNPVVDMPPTGIDPWWEHLAQKAIAAQR